MADRRWLVLVAAACVCGALYLGIEIGGYAASDVGGRITLTAAIPAVLVIAFWRWWRSGCRRRSRVPPVWPAPR